MRQTILLIISFLLASYSGIVQGINNSDSTDYYYQKCKNVYTQTDNTSSKDIQTVKKACKWFINNNKPVYEAWCYALIGSNYYKNNNNDSACSFFTKSLNTYKKADFIDSLAVTYDRLATCLYYKGSFRLAKINYTIGLLYPAPVNNKASLLNGLAISYEALSLYDSALLTYNKALDLYKSTGDSLGIAYTYSNIGSMYLQQEGVQPEAKNYLLKAYNIIKKTDDKFALAGITSNLATYYSYNSEYQKALENYLITYRIDSTLKNKFQIGVDLNNIGTVYLDIKDTLNAKRFLTKALQIGSSINAKQIVSYASYNLGHIDLLLNHLESALTYANLSLKSSKETEGTADIISALQLLSKIYSKKGDYQIAYNYLNKYTTLHDSILSVEKSRQLAEVKEKYKATQQQNKILFLEKENLKTNNIQTLLIISIILITLFLIFVFFSYQLVKKNRNQIKKQHLYFEKLLSNSIEFTFLIDKNRVLKYVSPSYTEMFKGKPGDTLKEAFYYNLDKDSIEKINHLLNLLYNGKKRVSFELEIHNIKGKTRFVTGVAQNFLNDNIIKGIIVNLWDVTKLKEAGDVLQKREQELEASNQTKEKLFSIISHDLIGNIGTTSELMKLLDDNFESFDEEEKHKIISSVTGTLETTYTLVSNLLSWARIQMKKISTDCKAVLLHPIIIKIANLYRSQLSDKAIELTIDCDKTTQVLADPNQLEFIFRNLVRNAIKFTHTGGNIWFSCITHKGFVTVTIKDNGIGMNEKKINELLSNTSELTSTVGTNNEQGTGLGLIIVKEFIQLNKGKLQINSKPGEGTEILITFLAS
jgi:signal transduction histidine kinase